MTYTKPSLVFRMLREMLGEPTMRQVLRTYHEQNTLQHVTEQDFRAAVNQVTGRDYGWFFDQWLHTRNRLDYGIADARTRQLADGRWSTRVEVLRLGQAWMPVELQVGETVRTLDSREQRQAVELVTRERPREAMLDPRSVLLDMDPTTHRAAIR
jgi:hypothetical protein